MERKYLIVLLVTMLFCSCGSPSKKDSISSDNSVLFIPCDSSFIKIIEDIDLYYPDLRNLVDEYQRKQFNVVAWKKDTIAKYQDYIRNDIKELEATKLKIKQRTNPLKDDHKIYYEMDLIEVDTTFFVQL